ncbi:MAG: hypothetical protein KDA93_04805 [Planctomycetaceae bacterium]|nr:hypothetical protein [Planctomycetaceae bacterium]
MLAETSETLKSELTDKYVVVSEGVPELKRFAGLTGRVKTVNMNGRALVEFNGPADISWYDIDPSYLNVVDAPLPKKKAAAPAEDKPAAAKPAAKKAGGMSPLEMARQQGAGGATKKPASAAGGEKQLSPLEMARQQGAAGAAKPAEAKPAAAEKPAGGAKLSPLELARQQGAATSGDDAAAETPASEKPTETKKPASDDTAGLSPLELARRQGPAKG